jgi:endonuclease YncB( thermonuclease family)
MKHWDGRDRDHGVPLRLPRRDRRRLASLFEVPAPAPTRGDNPSATTIGVVLAMAVLAGLAWGLRAPEPVAAGADKPILWGESQAVPEAAPDAGDSEWAARGELAADAPRPARDERSDAAIPFFGFCHTGGGTNCVVDGDTFYISGQKVRIADIDAPETHPPRCAEEARLGEAATARLRDLLNSGAVTMAANDRDEDVYGRKLRTVEANGVGVGEALVAAGLARWYGSGRRSWCG